MKISNNFHTFRSVSCCCKLSFCILPIYWTDNEVFLCDNLANIYVLGTYYTLQCAAFQWEMLPNIEFKKLGRKMRESKVLEEMLDKLFMGEWPWLVRVPLMGSLSQKWPPGQEEGAEPGLGEQGAAGGSGIPAQPWQLIQQREPP